MSLTNDTSSGLEDADWKLLLTAIKSKRVIPVVGPQLVTVREGGRTLTLDEWLAPCLAESLGIPPDGLPSVNAVVCEAILRKVHRDTVSGAIAELVQNMPFGPSEALEDLALITDFPLVISSTFDPLLARAMAANRPEFRPDEHIVRNDLSYARDLPEKRPESLLYHLAGDITCWSDFAIWEEDYIELMCGFLEKRDNYKNLWRHTTTGSLLLLGAPFTDWIVRFFLRMARGGRRLSDTGGQSRYFLADRREHLSESMVFYVQEITGTTRVAPGSPVDFVRELARRWREGRSGVVADPLAEIPDVMPRDSVFISYAHEDADAVKKLAAGLVRAGVPVWLDKKRLGPGGHFNTEIEYQIKNECSYFLSVVSRTTENITGEDGQERRRYVHKEREWAATKQIGSYVFYIPVTIDGTVAPRAEPENCGHALLNVTQLPGGEVTPEFARKLRGFIEALRYGRRPQE